MYPGPNIAQTLFLHSNGWFTRVQFAGTTCTSIYRIAGIFRGYKLSRKDRMRFVGIKLMLAIHAYNHRKPRTP